MNIKDTTKAKLVHWVDSCNSEGWHQSARTDYSPVQCATLGFVIEDAEDFIALSATIAATDADTTDVMSIPKCCVKSIQDIEFPRDEIRPKGREEG